MISLHAERKEKKEKKKTFPTETIHAFRLIDPEPEIEYLHLNLWYAHHGRHIWANC